MLNMAQKFWSSNPIQGRNLSAKPNDRQNQEKLCFQALVAQNTRKARDAPNPDIKGTSGGCVCQKRHAQRPETEQFHPVYGIAKARGEFASAFQRPGLHMA